MSRAAFLDRVEAYFKARPLQWIHAREFETVGGRQAWRSRIAECRTQRGMDIENRQERRTVEDGSMVTDSFYCYTPRPADPIGPDAATTRERTLF